jgi:molybdenum-dependent DNA-binding transcriptional regulator ModE
MTSVVVTEHVPVQRPVAADPVAQALEAAHLGRLSASTFMSELRVDLLWAFVAVAEELSFTRAARRLHLSQSGLSRRVAMLEKLSGQPLVSRTTRRTALTPAGEAFLPHVRSVLLAAQAAQEALRCFAVAPPVLLGDAAEVSRPAVVRVGGDCSSARINKDANGS